MTAQFGLILLISIFLVNLTFDEMKFHFYFTNRIWTWGVTKLFQVNSVLYCSELLHETFKQMKLIAI